MGGLYRRQCPELVLTNQNLALNSTIYILRNVGPMGFYLKEEGGLKEHKVLLGKVHTCTCNAYQKDKELCRHICWVLLKRFKISKLDPISFQLGLTDRDIEEIVSASGPKIIESKDKSKNDPIANSINDSFPLRKEIQSDDVCPICQENLLEKHWPITYCRKGCGNNIHIRCMKIWADHQIADALTSAEDDVRCPYCRGEFCTLVQLNHEYKNDPTRFSKYSSEINSLKCKSDKDVIDTLDENQEKCLIPNREQTTNKIMRLVTTQTIPTGSRLVTDGCQCCLCLKNFQPRDIIGRLSCRHRFHRTCLTRWFMENKPVCPIDGTPLLTKCEVKIQTNNKRGNLKKEENKHELTFLVCGVPCSGDKLTLSQQTTKSSVGSPMFDANVDSTKSNGRNAMECSKNVDEKVNIKRVNLQNDSRRSRRRDVKTHLVQFNLEGTKLFQK